MRRSALIARRRSAPAPRSAELSDLIGRANDIVWSPPLVFLCLAAVLYFTIRLRLVQVRHIGGMIEQLRKGESSDHGVSSFR